MRAVVVAAIHDDELESPFALAHEDIGFWDRSPTSTQLSTSRLHQERATLMNAGETEF